MKHEYCDITKNNSNKTPGTGKMAQQKKMAATKLANLNWIPWTHELQGEYNLCPMTSIHASLHAKSHKADMHKCTKSKS